MRSRQRQLWCIHLLVLQLLLQQRPTPSARTFRASCHDSCSRRSAHAPSILPALVDTFGPLACLTRFGTCGPVVIPLRDHPRSFAPPGPGSIALLEGISRFVPTLIRIDKDAVALLQDVPSSLPPSGPQRAKAGGDSLGWREYKSLATAAGLASPSGVETSFESAAEPASFGEVVAPLDEGVVSALVDPTSEPGGTSSMSPPSIGCRR